jgi:CBS domain-containing protein
MAPEQSKRPVELPVRSLEIVERNGQSVRALRVFCPSRYGSIDTSTCAGCPFVQALSETSVACAPPDVPGDPEGAAGKPLFLGAQALALRTPVGEVCSTRAVAVRVDVPLEQARRVLLEYPSVVVIGDDDQVRGILSAAEPSDELATLAELPQHTPTVPEYAPLIEAIELMLRGHVRLVPVVGEDRRFRGHIADLDVLRWAARYQRPPQSKTR